MIKKPTGRNSWDIRDYREGDEIGMNDLFNTVFKLQRPLGHWAWKFEKNPLAPNKYICLAEKDQKILAMYPCLPSYFNYFSDRCVVLQAVDNCVHEDVRKGLKREGVFLKTLKGLIQQAVRKGCDFGFGFPTDEHFRYGEKKLGYTHVWKLPVMQKSLPGAEDRGGSTGRRIWSGLKKMIREEEKLFSVSEVAEFNSGFDQLWKKVVPDYKIAMERNAEFLNWRYIINPMGEYKCLAVHERGERIPRGYVVGQVKGGEVQRGQIFDFLLHGPRPAGLALLERLEDFFLAAGAKVVECRMFEHVPMYDILFASGFRPAPDAINVNAFLFNAEKISNIELGRKENWHLTLGDSDTE